MFGLNKDEVVRRNTLIYLWARLISNTGYRIFSRSHTESPSEFRKLKKKERRYSLHRASQEFMGDYRGIIRYLLPEVADSLCGDGR